MKSSGLMWPSCVKIYLILSLNERWNYKAAAARLVYISRVPRDEGHFEKNSKLFPCYKVINKSNRI